LANVSSSPPIVSATTTAASFADFVTSARIASSTAMVLRRHQAEFGGRLLRGVIGHLHLRVEPELAGLKLLEQQIERHDLGERGRVARRVRIGRVQHLARIRIDYESGVGRIVGGSMKALAAASAPRPDRFRSRSAQR